MDKEKFEQKIEEMEEKIKIKVDEILEMKEIKHDEYMILTGEIGRYKSKIYEEESKAKREEYMNAMSKMMSAM